tara:strand:+ start:458 stop:697 length:240 start_codon:yes stop_codon:yes gene_type:complete
MINFKYEYDILSIAKRKINIIEIMIIILDDNNNSDLEKKSKSSTFLSDIFLDLNISIILKYILKFDFKIFVNFIKIKNS